MGLELDVEETVLWPETLLPEGNNVGYVGGKVTEEAEVSVPVSVMDEEDDDEVSAAPETRADGDVREGLALVAIEDFGVSVSETAELSEVDSRAATTMSLALTWPTWKVVG